MKYTGAFFIFVAMISGEKKVKLSAETILSKISEYDIFRFYMPTKDWKLNQATLSPFRNENNPSFLISNRFGYLHFIDFTDTTKRGNCFMFVSIMFNVSHDGALKMIDRDFGLGIESRENIGEYKRIVQDYKQPVISKASTIIQASVRKFTNRELEYWNGYHLSEDDLKQNNVYAIKSVYLNKQRFPLKEDELVFGYLYGQHWKIYRPFGDKKSKWVPNNVPITEMDGKDDIQHCRIAIINKSKKDYMVMKKLFPCCCAVQNEGLGCFSIENVDYLKENSDIQILSFDSDEVGVQNSQKITKLFNFGYVNVPRKYLAEGIKDWADLAKAHGMSAVEEYINQKINYGYE